MSNLIDLMGKKINYFTVIERVPKIRPTTWRCQCVCGNFRNLQTGTLRNGLQKSCGCSKAELYADDSVLGTMINSWKVIERVGRTKDDGWLYKCVKPECGCEKILPIRRLKKLKHTFDCQLKYGAVGTLSHKYFYKLQDGANRRNLQFLITKKYIVDLLQKQDNKCAISGVPIELVTDIKKLPEQTASLDRIDSSIGYIEGNVWWVHKEVNAMKWTFTQDKLLNWVKVIYENNKEKMK